MTRTAPATAAVDELNRVIADVTLTEIEVASSDAFRHVSDWERRRYSSTAPIRRVG